MGPAYRWESAGRSRVVVAAQLAARLKATRSVATAVAMGADRFITNNQRDIPVTIAEVNVTCPADLAEAP